MHGRIYRFGTFAIAASVACSAIALSRTPERQVDEWRMRALSTRDWLSTAKLRFAAWSGSEAAAYALGSVLVVQKDPSRVQEGIDWLERAAEAGEVPAQLALGRVLLKGATGETPDYAQSRKWLERAARSLPATSPTVAANPDGHDAPAGAQAAYSLASIYRNGYGVPRDPAAGTHWLSLAASWGVAQAQFQLANVYRERGDDAQALEWLKRAAASENPEANLELAMAYRNGELGLHKDEAEYWSYVKETMHDYKHQAQN
ncbi:Sel1 domain-containing protein [Caballeronia hypogeia]|uniref:Sel1 domain-containing protein n=1 Tax=Caballeronia hypogeia TaxID=1777140 RepID=A0A158CQ98_9BURK|nr:tetratricopeptide repeat protein [Caballeronia hypogeia]SAK84431.1 Sel1 domain-containing protein [Caballeronia hypogeia]